MLLLSCPIKGVGRPAGRGRWETGVEPSLACTELLSGGHEKTARRRGQWKAAVGGGKSRGGVDWWDAGAGVAGSRGSRGSVHGAEGKCARSGLGRRESWRARQRGRPARRGEEEEGGRLLGGARVGRGRSGEVTLWGGDVGQEGCGAGGGPWGIRGGSGRRPQGAGLRRSRSEGERRGGRGRGGEGPWEGRPRTWGGGRRRDPPKRGGVGVANAV